jgi:WD40 repeat protein
VASSVLSTGTNIISHSLDDTVRLWNPSTGECLKIFSGQVEGIRQARILGDYEKSLSPLAVSDDGKMIASGFVHGQVSVWDTESGKEVFKFSEHQSLPHLVRFHPTKKQIASASYKGDIKIWDAEKGNCYTLSPYEKKGVSSISEEAQLTLVSFSHKETSSYPAIAIAYSPDGKRLAASFLDKSAYIWDTENIVRVSVLEGNYLMTCFAFSQDGSEIAGASQEGEILIWDINSGKRIDSIYGYDGKIKNILYDHPNKKIFIFSSNKNIHVWDREKKGILEFHPEKENMEFLKNRFYSISKEERETEIWDTNGELPTLYFPGKIEKGIFSTPAYIAGCFGDYVYIFLIAGLR